MSKRVLILGGCGFIGRHLVKALLEQKLASFIRVADKVLPQTAYLSKDLKKYFDDKDKVEHKQANLSNPAHIKKAFQDDKGKYDWVINLAAETRIGQEENQYKQMVFDISVNCAKEAASVGCEKYIEFSDSRIYAPGKKPTKEGEKDKPWTTLAKYKLAAEEEIKKLKLNYIIVRPAIVYGPGDQNGLLPRIICGSTYTHTKTQMKLLWTADLRINTVHVSDVVKATILLLQKGKVGDTYNLADKADLSQGKLNKLLEKLFGIKTGFLGSTLSNLAKIKMQDVVDVANENHMNPWSEMLKAAGIKFTPLSPYLDKELLLNNPLSLDGSKIESLGFKYDVPDVSLEKLEECIKYYQDLNIFPPIKKLDEKDTK